MYYQVIGHWIDSLGTGINEIVQNGSWVTLFLNPFENLDRIRKKKFIYY